MQRRPAIRLSAEHKRIIWRLRARGPASRTTLADALQINGAVMTRLARELIEFGVLEEKPRDQDGGRGRPTIPLTISGEAGYAAGAMLHPGWLELVLVDFTGRIAARDAGPFDSDDPRRFCEEVDRRLKLLALDNGLALSRFLGLGVAVTGPPIVATNRRWSVEWLKGWREIDYPDDLAHILGFPVWVENDATLAGLAEYDSSGLIHTCRSALIFFIGHGVGGGVIHDRAILRGEFNNGGDVGQLFPLGAPRPSGIDLLGVLQAAGADIRSLLEIESCIDRFDTVVRDWVDRAAIQLEAAGRSGVAWLDPGAVILSGALPQPILSALGERLGGAEWLSQDSWLKRPVLHVSTLGSWAAALGAALLPIYEIIASDPEERIYFT